MLALTHRERSPLLSLDVHDLASVWLAGGGCGWLVVGVVGWWWVWLAGGGCGLNDILGVLSFCYCSMIFPSYQHAMITPQSCRAYHPATRK